MKIRNQFYSINTQKKTNLCFCQLSDIHFSSAFPFSLFSALLKEVEKIKPDYIFITGDIIDDALVAQTERIKLLYQFLEQLGLYAPVFLILGNHDVTIHINRKREYTYDDSYLETLSHLNNVFLLKNDMYQDENICVFGYEQSPRLFKNEEKKGDKVVDELQSFNLSFPSSTYNVFLIHSPFIIARPNVQKQISFLKDVDLILCGHAHGGVLLPFLRNIKGNRGIISPTKRLFPKNVRGILSTQTPIIVHEGVITLSKTAGILRYCNSIFPSTINKINVSSSKKKIFTKKF